MHRAAHLLGLLVLAGVQGFSPPTTLAPAGLRPGAGGPPGAAAALRGPRGVGGAARMARMAPGRVGCGALRMREDKDKDGSVEYSDPLVSALGGLLPGGGGVGKSSQASVLDSIDWGAEKARGLDAGAMAARLDAGLRERGWFVTGNIMPELFSEDFEFKDPNVALKGVEDYARGVHKLFDQRASSMQVISTAVNGTDAAGRPTVTVTWRLEGRVNVGPGLEIKPYIVYTDLRLDAEGLVAEQEDFFSVPGWEILVWALLPFLRPLLPPPAPRP